MSSFIQQTISALFPRRCPVCGHFTDTSTPQLCQECAQKLEEEYSRLCPVCRRDVHSCTCVSADLPLICCGFYEPGNTSAITSRLIYALKHNADDSAAHVLARDLSRLILQRFLAEGEDIRTWTFTYAPRSPEGYEKNGFDQARRLAKLCARYTGARYDRIFRRQGGDAQKRLSAAERETNASVSIRLRHPQRNHTGKYVVVDDILTTGATLCECADLLRSRGANAVWIAAPLRTLPRSFQNEPWFARVGKYNQ